MESKATGCAVSHVAPKLSVVPVLQLLASQVRKILLLPGLTWSVTVKHLALHTRVLIDSNAKLCLSVQVGNCLCVVVKGSQYNGEICQFWQKNGNVSDKARKASNISGRLRYRPLHYFSHLEVCGSIPQAEIWCLRKSNLVRGK